MGLDLDDDLCNAGLVLGLGTALIHPLSKIKSSLPALVMAAEGSSVEPTLTLGLSAGRDRQGSPPAAYSAVSSFSNACSVKRERDLGGSEVEAEAEVEERVVSSGGGDDQEEDCSTTRKKLRLTKEQSALLEDSFRQHSTLNPKQKQALARQLNLRARQVEVWFQNRRARTKLKQTEVECEFLKKCCETLTEENRRLQKELQELRAAKLAHQPPLYMQLPAATLTMCPSCERIADAPKGAFTITNAPKRPHFYNLFTNPSAAC